VTNTGTGEGSRSIEEHVGNGVQKDPGKQRSNIEGELNSNFCEDTLKLSGPLERDEMLPPGGETRGSRNKFPRSSLEGGTAVR